MPKSTTSHSSSKTTIQAKPFRIQKKFMKVFFQLKDNVLDKKLSIVVNSQTFANRKQIQTKVSEVMNFYAEHFTQANIKKAEE